MDVQMKKRLLEGCGILALLAAAFAVFNFVAGGLGGSTVQIDGQFYSTGERELTLNLATENGTEKLSEFTRLEKLKITPYKEALVSSFTAEDEEEIIKIGKEAEEVFADYTDLEDLSFLSELTKLKELDISHCKTSDISFLEGFDELTYLNISYTDVSELDVLGGLDRLEILIVRGIPADDMSVLLEMDSLKTVYTDKAFDESVEKKLAEKGIQIGTDE